MVVLIPQAAPKGFFGAMRQRGMGGAKCGSTAATLLLLPGGGGNIDDVATMMMSQ